MFICGKKRTSRSGYPIVFVTVVTPETRMVSLIKLLSFCRSLRNSHGNGNYSPGILRRSSFSTCRKRLPRRNPRQTFSRKREKLLFAIKRLTRDPFDAVSGRLRPKRFARRVYCFSFVSTSSFSNCPLFSSRSKRCSHFPLVKASSIALV